MISVILTAEPAAWVARLEQAFAAHAGVQLQRCHSMAQALEAAGTGRPALMIIDQQVQGREALEIARGVLAVNAFVNLALISPMQPARFHQISEGLGVLAQLPPDPGAEQVERLLELLGRLA